MGHKHTKDEILEGALDAAFEDGLSQLTFGRVAKRLGIHDRTVVYYFPTKDELVREVLFSFAIRLQGTLAGAFTSTSKDHLAIVRAAWPIVSRPDAGPVFALFFEANGLAACGREPYRSVVPQLVEAWIAWVAEFLEGTPRTRRAEAEAAIALTDGLLLLQSVAGPEAADRAARKLGVR